KRQTETREIVGVRPQSSVPVQHSARTANGWAAAETLNFRIYHSRASEYVEQVANVAEKTRAQMLLKWFGGASDNWSLKCEIFLHATTQDYANATGQHNSPGHSTIRMENGRVVVRRIDLHCDDPNMLPAILPHE